MKVVLEKKAAKYLENLDVVMKRRIIVYKIASRGQAYKGS